MIKHIRMYTHIIGAESGFGWKSILVNVEAGMDKSGCTIAWVKSEIFLGNQSQNLGCPGMGWSTTAIPPSVRAGQSR